MQSEFTLHVFLGKKNFMFVEGRTVLSCNIEASTWPEVADFMPNVDFFLRFDFLWGTFLSIFWDIFGLNFSRKVFETFLSRDVLRAQTQGQKLPGSLERVSDHHLLARDGIF